VPFDFPNTPAEGATYSPTNGPQYIFQNGVWKQVLGGQSPVLTAQTRNRVVNGAMQISQENGNTASAAAGYYLADQWAVGFTTTGAVGHSRSSVTTPKNSRYVLGLQVNTADTSLAAGEYWSVVQYVEGVRIADFGWGTSTAKNVILRFSINVQNAASAGTYSVAIRNGIANNRSYAALFTAPVGWSEHVIVIPGDTTGTWVTDNTRALDLWFTLAAGSTWQTAPGAWTAGSFIAATGMSNGLATVGNAFNIADVGLYLDPDKTGVAPPWQMPDEAEETTACRRYWQTAPVTSLYHGLVASVSSIYLPVSYPPMRTNPAIAGASTTSSVYDNAGAVSNATGYTASNTYNGAFNIQASRTGGITGIVARTFQLSARM